MLILLRSAILAPVAALAFLLTAPVHAVEYIDYTDLWVDTKPPANSGTGGFGINFVQSGNSFDYIFATFFIYDPLTGKPDWVTGELTRETNKTSFAGNVYRTQGEPTTSPFAPRNTVTNSIGTVKFTPTSPTSGTLVYIVNGVTTTLELKRLTLTENILDGVYWGGASVVSTNCPRSGDNGTYHNTMALDVIQPTGGAQVTYTFNLDYIGFIYKCTLKGALIQEGRFQKINNANYVCYSGSTKLVDGTANLYNIAATTQGVEGKWISNKGIEGCKEEGYFSGVLVP
ncbi:MAG: hypothetical protein LBP90_02735 [Burkholderiales bacterium]|jgi:hypothetical protein|nr:hypothetical protein [Burkholderiales bacterium]